MFMSNSRIVAKNSYMGVKDTKYVSGLFYNDYYIMHYV
jgi:hypothetical protein